MPQVIQMGANPTQQIVSHFLDQYNENQRASQANALGQAQLAQTAKAQSDTASYQQGTLKDAQDKLAQLQKVYNDTRLQQKEKDFTAQVGPIQDTIDSLKAKNPNDPKIPALEAQAKNLANAAIQDEPGLAPYIQIANIARVISPQRQEQLATQDTFTGAAQGMAGGAPTPMQADVFSKKNFGNQGLSPQMTKDVQSQQPEAAAPPAGQPATPRTEYLRGPALGLDTTAEQDQAAQTQKAVANIQEAGATKRTGMTIAAAAPYQAAVTREAAAKAQISEGDAKMASGDPTALNSYALAAYINPRSYANMTPDAKKMAEKGLGGRAPAQLNTTEQTAFDASQNTIAGVDRASAIIDKWAAKGIQITGPMLGRYNATSNTWGDQILPSNLDPKTSGELQGDIAGLQENFGINKLNELKTTVGGRVPASMIPIISAPTIAQNPAMLKGALATMKQIAQGRADQLESIVWNGHPPVLTGATAEALHKALGAGSNPADPAGLFGGQ